MNRRVSRAITHWQLDGHHARTDSLAAETPLELWIDHCDGQRWQRQSLVVMMRTPGDDINLALGFLLTESIIRGRDDVERIEARLATERQRIVVRLHDHVRVDVQKMSRHLLAHASCGLCSKSSIDAVFQLEFPRIHVQGRVIPQLLLKMPETLGRAQENFGHTGGLHASGIFDFNGQLHFIFEDVGRHNALDKVIGAALQAGLVPLENYLLLLSGRVSFELMQKAARAGLGVVAALGAPSDLAVSFAAGMQMTLIGFLREGSFNIYAGEQRVSLSLHEDGDQSRER